MSVGLREECNSKYCRITSSVTLPLVVEKYPRAQNRRPQYRFPSSGYSIWILSDDRPLIRWITFDKWRCGGINKNIWRWSVERTPLTILTPISSQLCRIISRKRSRMSPCKNLKRYLVTQTRWKRYDCQYNRTWSHLPKWFSSRWMSQFGRRLHL